MKKPVKTILQQLRDMIVKEEAASASARRAQEEKVYAERRKREAAERERRRIADQKRLDDDRTRYEAFVINMIKAGAIKGKVPSFTEWRGDC